MKDNPQYIVIFKDNPKALNRYYGPFVSDSKASDFMDALPEPLPGGSKTYKLLSNFTFDEMDRAHDEIVYRRQSTTNLEQAYSL